jgi:hypothetical protein
MDSDVVLRIFDDDSEDVEMANDFILELLALLFDFGGDGRQDGVLVVFQRDCDLFFDVELAEISHYEMFSIVYFGLAEPDIGFDFFNFCTEMVIIVILIALGCKSILAELIDLVERFKQYNLPIDSLVDTLNANFELFSLIIEEVDAFDVLLKRGIFDGHVINIMGFDNIFDDEVEFLDSDDFIVEFVDSIDEGVYAFLQVAEDVFHAGFNRYFILLIDIDFEVEAFLDCGVKQYPLFIADIVRVLNIQFLDGFQNILDVVVVAIVELLSELFDMVDEIEDDGLQLMKLKHATHFVDNF